jgi:hypothetical protein
MPRTRSAKIPSPTASPPNPAARLTAPLISSASAFARSMCASRSRFAESRVAPICSPRPGAGSGSGGGGGGGGGPPGRLGGDPPGGVGGGGGPPAVGGAGGGGVAEPAPGGLAGVGVVDSPAGGAAESEDAADAEDWSVGSSRAELPWAGLGNPVMIPLRLSGAAARSAVSVAAA